MAGLTRRSAAFGTTWAALIDAMMSTMDGLELGAEDYIVKPYSVPELVDRVRSGCAVPRFPL